MTHNPGRRRLLFICTANICRSPTAELLARGHFGEVDMVFRSAGFLQAGERCPRELVEVMRGRGIEADGHRSYQLDEASINAAELLLTMEGRHVQKATMINPDAFHKIVPLREAAAVLAQMPPGAVALEDFVAELNRDRDPRRYLGKQWDVEDPFGGKVKAYRKAAIEIDGLVRTVIGRLR